MNNQQVSMWEHGYTGIGKTSAPARVSTRERGQGLSWKARARAAVRPVALPGASLLLLIGVVSVPLPANAASLGSGWGARISTGASNGTTGSTVAWGQYASTHIGFNGTLAPSIGRTTVRIVVQKLGANPTTVGTMTTLATRVFNTQPASLPSLFATMGVTAQPNTTYRIAVDAGSSTLTSTTVTLAR
ncbi:MAG TPA: hypothetical protein VNL71_15275 [Chloroflexota bacterium]|nr:hypothetical protein [Chloroflexota bacterium]